MPMVGTHRGWADDRCRSCSARRLAFRCAFAAFEYGEALASAILRMKHGGRLDLARPLGRLLASPLARAIDADHPDRRIDAVVPVPLHPRKLRKRGYNQALALAKTALARIATIPARAGPVPRLERGLLLRVKDTRELGRVGPVARRDELRGAFAVRARSVVEGARLVVVDDVMTTGATLHECAKTLIQAGAREVRVAALARAVI